MTQGERLSQLEAEDWISRWQSHAETEGLTHVGAFWGAASEWITEQRAPKQDMGAEADDGQVHGG